MKKILLTGLLATSLSFASESLPKKFECTKLTSEINLILKTDENLKIVKIKNSKDLRGWCEVYTELNNELDIVYIEPLQKTVLSNAVLFKTVDGMLLPQTNKLKDDYYKEKFETLKNNVITHLNSKDNTDLEELLKISLKTKQDKSKYSMIMFDDINCKYCKEQREYLKDKKLTLYTAHIPAITTLEEIADKVPAQTKENLEKIVDIFYYKLKLRGSPNSLIIDNTTNKVIDVVFGAEIDDLKRYFDENKKDKE